MQNHPKSVHLSTVSVFVQPGMNPQAMCLVWSHYTNLQSPGMATESLMDEFMRVCIMTPDQIHCPPWTCRHTRKPTSKWDWGPAV